MKNNVVRFRQTQTKPQKGTEFKMKVPMETFSPVNQIKLEERKSMINFTGLEVQIVIFKIGEQNETFLLAKKILKSSSNYKQKKVVTVTNKREHE